VIFALAAFVADWKPPPCALKDPRICAAHDLLLAERKMDAEFRATIRRLRYCKPRDSTKCDNMPRAIQLIQSEQRAWTEWRDTHCDVFAFSVENTSADVQVRNDCRTELTVKRTQELAKVRND